LSTKRRVCSADAQQSSQVAHRLAVLAGDALSGQIDEPQLSDMSIYQQAKQNAQRQGVAIGHALQRPGFCPWAWLGPGNDGAVPEDRGPLSLLMLARHCDTLILPFVIRTVPDPDQGVTGSAVINTNAGVCQPV